MANAHQSSYQLSTSGRLAVDWQPTIERIPKVKLFIQPCALIFCPSSPISLAGLQFPFDTKIPEDGEPNLANALTQPPVRAQSASSRSGC